MDTQSLDHLQTRNKETRKTGTSKTGTLKSKEDGEYLKYKVLNTRIYKRGKLENSCKLETLEIREWGGVT